MVCFFLESLNNSLEIKESTLVYIIIPLAPYIQTSKFLVWYLGFVECVEDKAHVS